MGPTANKVIPPAFRHVIPEALTLIKSTEGLSLKPYQGSRDRKGTLTVGYGHKIVLGEEHLYDHGITVKQAEDLLSRDVARHCQFIQQDMGGPNVYLDDWVFGALASFCYNLGPRILLTAHHVVSGGIMEFYRFCHDGNGDYSDGLFYRRIQETVLGINKVLVKRPGSCVEAQDLMAKIPDSYDIVNYFNNHHVKALCNVCKYRKINNGYRLPAPGPVTKSSGKQPKPAR